MLRDALIALSSANLCFFSVWGNLLSGSQLHYYIAMPPPGVAHVAILLNVLLLATLFWLGWTAANLSLSKRARSLARLIFLVFAFLALNGMRIYTQALAPAALSPLFIQSTFVVLAIGAIGIVSVLYWRTWFCRLTVMAVLIMSPLVF